MPHSTVTALALKGAERHFAQDGINIVQVGRKLDLDESIWSDLNRDIPLRKFVGLLESLGNISNDPAIVWQAGYDFNFTQLGEIGEVLDKSRTLGDALTNFRDFFFLLQTDAYLDLVINENETRIQYKILDTNIWPRRGDAEFTLGLFQRVISHYTGSRDFAGSFQLEDYSGTGIALERQIQRRFAGNGAYNELTFPTKLLYCEKKRNQPFQDVTLRPLVTRLREKRSAKKRRIPTPYQVQCCIYRKIGTSPVNQTSIAEELGMSRRTLRRKLSDENYSFQQLLDHCRMQLATVELIRGDLSFSEIALKSGFSEQSAFTRAFSKWSGKTPTEFRREKKSRELLLLDKPKAG